MLLLVLVFATRTLQDIRIVTANQSSIGNANENAWISDGDTSKKQRWSALDNRRGVVVISRASG